MRVRGAFAREGLYGADVLSVREAALALIDGAGEAFPRGARLLDGNETDVLMEDLKVSGLKPRRLREMTKFFSKGRPILIEGRLRQDSWEDKQTGQKRTKLLVVLERFEFVGSRDQQGGGYGGGGYDGGDYSSSSPAPRQPRHQPQQRSEDLEDDDVPF